MPQPELRFDTLGVQIQSLLDAEIDSVTLIDKDKDPNRVIDSHTQFDIEIKWHVSGTAALLLDGAIWSVDVYAESMGPGPELKLASDNNFHWPVTTMQRTDITKKFSNVSAVDQNGAMLNGPFLLTVVLATRNASGVPVRVAGFYEGPMAQFYIA